MTRLAAAALLLSFVVLTACSSSSPNSNAPGGRRSPAAVASPSVASPSVASPSVASPSVASPSDASSVPTVTFGSTQLRFDTATGTTTLDVLVAIAPLQTERGLSYRDSLPRDTGMLFDMGSAQILVFWMKGMRFPLDMVWIGDDKRVVGITENVPPQPAATDAQLIRYSPPAPARYVLELNAGAASRLGITQGALLVF